MPTAGSGSVSPAASSKLKLARKGVPGATDPSVTAPLSSTPTIVPDRTTVTEVALAGGAVSRTRIANTERVRSHIYILPSHTRVNRRSRREAVQATPGLGGIGRQVGLRPLPVR